MYSMFRGLATGGLTDPVRLQNPCLHFLIVPQLLGESSCGLQALLYTRRLIDPFGGAEK
jgi:hypothetical protein